MPNSSQLRASTSICFAEIGSAERLVEAGGRDVVVHRRDREVGPAHAPARGAQAVERLRRRDLVHEVQIDVEEVGLARRRGGRRGDPRPSRTGSGRGFGHRTAPVSRYETLVSLRGQCNKSASRCSIARCCVLDTVARGGPCSLADLAARDRASAPDRVPARGRARAPRRAWRATATAASCSAAGSRRGARSPGAGCPTPAARCWRGSARRRARARSCTCARATTACASRCTSGRAGCATPCRSVRCCPLDRGSGGKVLLAWAADAATLRGARPASSPTVRRRGWAASVGEREAGVASVSAPVFDGPGAVVAAVSVSGPIDRLGPHPGRRLAAAVTAAGGRLSAALGGPGSDSARHGGVTRA